MNSKQREGVKVGIVAISLLLVVLLMGMYSSLFSEQKGGEIPTDIQFILNVLPSIAGTLIIAIAGYFLVDKYGLNESDIKHNDLKKWIINLTKLSRKRENEITSLKDELLKEVTNIKGELSNIKASQAKTHTFEYERLNNVFEIIVQTPSTKEQAFNLIEKAKFNKLEEKIKKLTREINELTKQDLQDAKSIKEKVIEKNGLLRTIDDELIIEILNILKKHKQVEQDLQTKTANQQKLQSKLNEITLKNQKLNQELKQTVSSLGELDNTKQELSLAKKELEELQGFLSLKKEKVLELYNELKKKSK